MPSPQVQAILKSKPAYLRPTLSRLAGAAGKGFVADHLPKIPKNDLLVCSLQMNFKTVPYFQFFPVFTTYLVVRYESTNSSLNFLPIFFHLSKTMLPPASSPGGAGNERRARFRERRLKYV
jgi:hypothetical protein